MGVMSGSGFLENGSNQACGNAWHAPQISVLVFRATANSVGPGDDSNGPNTFGNAPSPPSPPPPKGQQDCDGAVLAAGVGTSPKSFGGLAQGSHNKGGVFPEHSLSGCAVQGGTT